MTETEIISALKQSDQNAISALYDLHGAKLFGVILRIVQSPELAEEVMQEVFLKIWRSADSFDESKGNFYSWVLNIARNTAIDTARNSDHRLHHKTDHFDFFAFQDRHPSPEMAAGTIGLREIVNRFDEKHRRVIDLAFFQGFTQDEIEREMNIPVGTVKTRLRLVLRELRKIFSGSSF